MRFPHFLGCRFNQTAIIFLVLPDFYKLTVGLPNDLENGLGIFGGLFHHPNQTFRSCFYNAKRLVHFIEDPSLACS